MAFEEACLIIECKLTQITTANADDFYSEEAKVYLPKVYTSPGEIHNIWVKKYE